MYRKIPLRKDERKTINIGVIFLIIILGIFGYRAINILSSNKERGGLDRKSVV